jgi:putative cofactor-binding repeat protein
VCSGLPSQGVIDEAFRLVVERVGCGTSSSDFHPACPSKKLIRKETTMKIATRKMSLFALFALIVVPGAVASTVQVGGCKDGFTNYSTISAAVAAVPAGSTILICPGTYAEQVNISQSLTLQGVQTSNAANPTIIVPSGATGTYDQVNISGTGSTTVNLSNIGVNGSSSTTSSVVGVSYQNASGTLSHMAVYNQGGAGGAGVGITIMNSESTQTVTVSKSSIHDFTGTGIATGSGGNVVIDGNRIVTSDSFRGWAAAGIDLYSNGSVTNNLLITHPQPPGVSAGVGITTEANASVTGNTIENFTIGIWLLEGSNTAASNTILLAQSGIVISGDNNIVELNSFANDDPSNIGYAIDFNCTGTGNTVINNTISDTYAAFGASAGFNMTSPNSYFNVPFIVGAGC